MRSLKDAAPRSFRSLCERVVYQVYSSISEQEITESLPAAEPFLSPRPFVNTDTTATACDCAGAMADMLCDHLNSLDHDP